MEPMKDERIVGHRNLKDSIETVGKQETPEGGSPEEVGKETGCSLEVQTGDTASKRWK
ncbi:MAG: hypothetical protein LBS62_01665 [Clostridiales bacterium]|nr:hypothetical protein [Clostridiales bacterium]